MKVPIVGAGVSFASAVIVGYFIAMPYLSANSPEQWSWLVVPMGALFAAAIVFGVGWFFTVLITALIMGDW